MIVPIKEHILIELKKSTLVQDDIQVGSHQEGDVIAVGDEVTYVSVGDHVFWQQYTESNVFERDGRQLTLVDEQHIMAREENDATKQDTN